MTQICSTELRVVANDGFARWPTPCPIHAVCHKDLVNMQCLPERFHLRGNCDDGDDGDDNDDDFDDGR